MEQQLLTELLCFPWQGAAGDEEGHPEVLGCAGGTDGTERGRGLPMDQEQSRLLLLRHFPSWYLPVQLLWGLECSTSAPVFAQGRFSLSFQGNGRDRSEGGCRMGISGIA